MYFFLQLHFYYRDSHRRCISLAGWLCECCSTVPGCPDGAKHDSMANFLPQPEAGMVVNGGWGEEEAGCRDNVGDRGHPTLLLGTPRRNSEGELLLVGPDPERPSMMPHKTSYDLKSTCSQHSGAAAPFLLKSLH